jgi:hypothetical protein
MNLIGAGRVLCVHDPASDTTHIWFVLTDPDPDGRVVIVMARTLRPYTESTVVLQVGDHPFVEHATTLDYSAATLASASKLTGWLGHGRAVCLADASKSLLSRILIGLLKSTHTPNYLVSYIGGDPPPFGGS